MIQLDRVFSLSLSQSGFTAHLVCNTTSCCTLSLIQDFRSHFWTVDRIVTCLIGSLLYRHKNLLFARLFKPVGIARSSGGFKAERSQSHPKPPSKYHIELFFRSLLLSLSGQIHTKLRKNGRPVEYPGFFLSKCEQLRKKTQVYRLLDPCIMSCESRAVHMSRLLRAQVLYFKCRCAASAVIIED